MVMTNSPAVASPVPLETGQEPAPGASSTRRKRSQIGRAHV